MNWKYVLGGITLVGVAGVGLWVYRNETIQEEVSGRVLELGCGLRKTPNSTCVDKISLPTVDAVHDLDVYPYPFDDGSFDTVVANHVLEHLTDVIKSMEEIHRILSPSGILIVRVPPFFSYWALNDPTHKHSFTMHSLDYFDPDTPIGKNYGFYTKAKFKILRKYLKPSAGEYVFRLQKIGEGP